MVNGAFQIMQCQTNQLWLYLELNVILHDVLQLVSSSRGYLKWKRSTKHKLTSAVLSVKQLMSCSKEYRNNFQSPLSIVLYFPVTAHMLPHITPLNVPTECVPFCFLKPATSLLLQSSLPLNHHCGTQDFKQLHRKKSNRPKSSDQAGHVTCSLIPIHLHA